MTTAARPTFEPAKGGAGKGENDLSALSKQYSSRDLPSHTKLKYRKTGQKDQSELRDHDFRKELEDRERRDREKKETERGPRDVKRPRLNELLPSSSSNYLDADDKTAADQESDDDSDDDEDDTAALLAELQKIKKERANEAVRLEEERKNDDERIRTENIIKGNPLLNTNVDYKVKRRWDDDVVFKNCAKGDDKKNRGFINDTLRSEFHKRFMDKYVR